MLEYFNNPVAEKINNTLYVIRELDERHGNEEPIVVMFAFTKIYVSSSMGHVIYDVSKNEETVKAINFSSLATKDFDYFKSKLIVFNEDLYVANERFWEGGPSWQKFVSLAKTYLGYEEDTTDKDTLGEQIAIDYLLVKARDYFYIDNESKEAQKFDSWSFLNNHQKEEWEKEIYSKMTEKLQYETVIDIDSVREYIDSAVCAVLEEESFFTINPVFKRFYQAIKVITSNFTYDTRTNPIVLLKDLDRTLF